MPSAWPLLPWYWPGNGWFDDGEDAAALARALGMGLRVKLKKILIYLAIACCNGTGDVLLKRGMEDLGAIHLSRWTHIFNAFLDPWIILGIIFLAGFFYAYLTALSWADLTYVLPATALGYVVTAF